MNIDVSKLSPQIEEVYQVANNTFSATPKADWKDKIQVEVGDSKQPDFKPQVKIMRWDNECNVSIRLLDFDNFTVSKQGEKIKLINHTKEVHFYNLGVSEEHPEDAQEFEVILKEKPKTNVLEFTIQDKGVEYFYQSKLTQEQITNGDYQPENIDGSYAVYASENKINYVGGKEYKVGKVGHIYRPKIIDSVGTEVWGDLHIKNGILSVTIPQDFLDNAVYPVRHAAGLTFGWTTDGATAININANFLRGLIFTGAAGTGSSMTIRSAKQTSGTGKQQMALYKVSDNSLVGQTGELTFTTTASTQSSNFTVGPALTAIDYYLSSLNDSAMKLYTDNTGATQYYVARTYTDGFPATVSFSSISDRRYTIYCTYTAGGGGGAVVGPGFKLLLGAGQM